MKIVILLVILYALIACTYGQALTCQQMQQLTASYFTANRTALICISNKEAGWDPSKISGDNYGLFQLPTSVLGKDNCPGAGQQQQLLNADVAAKCAAYITASFGLNYFPAWKNKDCVGWNTCQGTQTTTASTSAPSTKTSNTATKSSNPATKSSNPASKSSNPASKSSSPSGKSTQTSTNPSTSASSSPTSSSSPSTSSSSPTTSSSSPTTSSGGTSGGSSGSLRKKNKNTNKKRKIVRAQHGLKKLKIHN